MARDSDKGRKSGSSRKRKARPVATSRVTVEVLKTVKEGFAGESESSSSSSEADDEDEGEEIIPRSKAVPKPMEEANIPAPSASATRNDATTESEPEPEPEKKPGLVKQESNTSNETVELASEKTERFIPPSPGLNAATGLERVATLPNLSENELSQPERNSVLRAFSLFQNWTTRPVERGPEVIYPG
jgi:1-phosphatidylinositol-3-phosphate 5-kinase